MRTQLCTLSISWLLLAAIPALAEDGASPPHAAGQNTSPHAHATASAPAAALPSNHTPTNHTPGVEETAASCRARWKEYRDSLACFAPYRHSEHVLDVEAYKHCKVVKEPTDCPPEFK